MGIDETGRGNQLKPIVPFLANHGATEHDLLASLDDDVADEAAVDEGAAASRLRMPSIWATSSIEEPSARAVAPRQATNEFGRTSGSSPSPARSIAVRIAS